MKTLGFKNQIFTKKELKQAMYQIFTDYGLNQASQLADDLKSLGFNYATQAGISISIEDLKITPTKPEILLFADREISTSNTKYKRGEISSIERFQTVVNTWNNTSESVKNSLVNYFSQTDPLNSIYLMAFSGARGNLSQVRQLVGMRGLMSDPNGQIIDIPIVHNFREGLTITDYIMSSYGARKGVVDTALKTADSGYLTRRLVDVAQDVVIREHNCFTKRSIRIDFNSLSRQTLMNKLVGRTCAREFIYWSKKSKKRTVFPRNAQISKSVANDLINDPTVKSIFLRSPLICESLRSICQLCYGWNLASASLVSLGDAIGIIAAQSIGEPGTQLTMRTFHTGGIFTADPSRQIRAQFSGVIHFESELKFRWGRTIYGTAVKILDQAIEVKLISYQNQITTFSLEANSSLFVDNGHYVKLDQLLGELPLLSQKTIREKKPIFAPLDGEFIPRQNENIVWVLGGKIIDIPDQSLVNNLKDYNQSITSIDRFASSKLIAKQSGLLNIKRNRKAAISILQILDSVATLDFVPFFNVNGNSIFLVSKFFDFYEIPLHYFKNSQFQLSLVAHSNPYYYIPTSGSSYLVQSKHKGMNLNSRLLYTPEEIHLIHRDSSLLVTDPVVQLPNSGVELVRGRFSSYSGFFNTVEFNDIIQDASIKPGIFYEYTHVTQEELAYLKSLDSKVFYPGEILFHDISISALSLVEFIQAPLVYGVIVRPILDFNIPKSKITPIVNVVNTSSLNSISNNIIPCVESKRLKTIEGGYLVRKHLDLKFSVPIKFKLVSLDFKIASPALITEDLIEIRKALPKQYYFEQVYFSTYLNQYQFVEKGTVLGRLSNNVNISVSSYESLKTQWNDICRIMFTTSDNYQTYYFETPFYHDHSLKFLKSSDFINFDYQVQDSGQIVNYSPYSLTLRRGIPLFFKQGMQFTKNAGSFVRKDEPLGFISYEQVITGDIVQGLPKIEEILEARKPLVSAQLASFPGVVRNIEKRIEDNELLFAIKIKMRHKEESTVIVKNLSMSQDLLCAPTDYIALGQPLTTGSINPHDALNILFKFYKRTNSFYTATHLSFKNLQVLLIDKVQQVYNSQGVDIADKHLEIIVRQMTSKVKILNPGSTFLTQGEIIDLLQVRYINDTMRKNNRVEATYGPLLCGITKASLLTDSFISAASFQETTKILMSAAIKGKVDWLRGLKENVIIGRLIPAGTGFISEDDFGLEQLTFF